MTRAPRPDVLEEARRLTDIAGARDAPVRLLGGIAIIMQRAGERLHAALRRTPLSTSTSSRAPGRKPEVGALLSASGYRPNEADNRLASVNREGDLHGIVQRLCPA